MLPGLAPRIPARSLQYSERAGDAQPLAMESSGCFGRCHGGGNVLDFIARMEAVNVREAALLLVEWFGPTRATRRRAAGRNRGE